MPNSAAPRTHALTKSRRTWRKRVWLLPVLVAATLACLVMSRHHERLIPPPPIAEREDEALELIGAAFRSRAERERGGYFPYVSAERGVFCPDMTEFRRYFGNSAEGQHLVDYLEGDGGVDVCYLGFMALNDEMGLALLDAYEALGPLKWRADDVDLDGKEIPLDEIDKTTVILRLREGVERLLIHEAGDSVAGDRAQARIPVLWEMPAPPARPGGWVLYMDGHKDWRAYPGEFPMTEPFIARLRGLMKPHAQAQAVEATAVPTSVDTSHSPVGKIALSAIEELMHPAARRAADCRSYRRGLKTIVQCDELPSVQASGRSGYRIILRLTANEYIGASKTRPPLVKARYEHVELVLFPSLPGVSGQLKWRIPWHDFAHEDFVMAADMGEGQGYHWLGRMTVPQHFLLREAMGLTGGDDPYLLAKVNLANAQHDTARIEAYRLLASTGEQALPLVMKSLANEATEIRGAAITDLAAIQGPDVDDILLNFYNSSDMIKALTATDVLVRRPRADLKEMYFRILEGGRKPTDRTYSLHRRLVADMVIQFGWDDTKQIWLAMLTKQALAEAFTYGTHWWRKESIPLYAPAKLAVHFAWKEAVPLLEAYCEAPYSVDSYRVAYEARRAIEGRPVPETLASAERAIRGASRHASDSSFSTREQIAEAKNSLLACDDKEAVALVTIDLATMPENTMASLEPEVVRAAMEVARALPREAVLYHLRHLTHLTDRGFAEFRAEFTH